MSDIRTGQIWREDDKRFERYILITHVHHDGEPTFITCYEDGARKPRSRHSNAKPERFGKSGGYKLHRDAP